MTDAEVLLAWSDDLFLHGHYLGRWITDYVDLEESLAVGSLSQDDMAHAGTLLELTGVTPAQRHERIFTRPTRDWASSRLLAFDTTHWPTTVARGLLVAAGSLVLADALGESRIERVKQAASVMSAEQRLHLTHWERWVKMLADSSRNRTELADALVEMLGLGADLFGTPPAVNEPESADVGVHVDLEAMHDRWRHRVRAQMPADDLVPEAAWDRTRVDRAFGADIDRLGEVLATIRALRTAHPDDVYPVYQ